MRFLIELVNNKPLVIAAVSWLVAGILKMIIELRVNKKLQLSRIVGAGGMPSSHTSTVVALAIALGYYNGIRSSEFALAAIFAIIVIHDAVGVRLETGKQAKVLNTMMFESEAFKDLDFEKQLKEYVGHTPLQALAGAIVGIIVSTLMIFVVYK
ncbi:MAG: divergent PAP2 family protein [Lachnospiraceae bacterium]|nr:divergent PAP2 family protein [Lachnospiraceae bacterium]